MTTPFSIIPKRWNPTSFVQNLPDTVARKSVNAARMLNIIARHVGPMRAAVDILARRAAMFPRQALGFMPSWGHKQFRFKTPSGKTFPFVCNERFIPYPILKEILIVEIYQPSIDLGNDPLVIFDIGGNIGMATAWFLDKYPNATIHVFEPGQGSFPYLQQNVAAWNAQDRAILNNKGTWSENSRRTLYEHPMSSRSSSFFERWSTDQGLVARQESVPIARLDHYMAQASLKRIDLLKVDIEGGELEALKGLGNRISDVRIVIGEVHMPIVSKERLARFMEDRGFSFTIRRELSPTTALFEAINLNW